MDVSRLEVLWSWVGRPEVLPLVLMVAAIAGLAVVSLCEARTGASDESEG